MPRLIAHCIRDEQEDHSIYQTNCLPAVLTAFEAIPIRHGIRVIEHALGKIETDTVLSHIRLLLRGVPFIENHPTSL